MRGHSRAKDGVLSHTYDPRIHDTLQRARTLEPLLLLRVIMDCRVKPGDDRWWGEAFPFVIPGRAESANPESRNTPGACVWIPGPALRAVPE